MATTERDAMVDDARAILARDDDPLDARRRAVLDRLLVARPLPAGATAAERATISRALAMILDATDATLDAIERQIA